MADTGLIPTLPLGIYRHSKSGRFYLVTGIAKDATDDTITAQNIRVMYRALYGDFSQYHRTLADFTAQVPKPEEPGTMMIRFEFVSAFDTASTPALLEQLGHLAPLSWESKQK